MLNPKLAFWKNKDQDRRKRPTGLFFGTNIAVNIVIVIALIIGLSAITIEGLFYTLHDIVTVEFSKGQCVIDGNFDLKWMHSVEKQWWIESYEAHNEQLFLTDTYLQTFGAGTPSTEKIGTNNHRYPGYVHYQINTLLPHLNWMISSHIKAQIITDQKTLPIYQWVDDYTNIYIFAVKQNLWTVLRQESCNDYTTA